MSVIQCVISLIERVRIDLQFPILIQLSANEAGGVWISLSGYVCRCLYVYVCAGVKVTLSLSLYICCLREICPTWTLKLEISSAERGVKLTLVYHRSGTCLLDH